MKTIVDILKKGNQELFHSAMIAWLLDPEGEHGYGTRFLEAFVDIISRKNPAKTLNDLIKDPSKINVNTEVKSGKYRFDIKVELDPENESIIIENKTKSVGETTQLEAYREKYKNLVALGLTEFSFKKSDFGGVTYITYSKILEILKSLTRTPTSQDENAFQILIEHYKKFLDRELGLLDMIREYGETGDEATLQLLVKSIENTQLHDNDIRFLYLNYFEGFRRFISNTSRIPWKNWKSYKNSISGVWLANPDDNDFENHLELESWVRETAQKLNAKFWLHIELLTYRRFTDNKAVGEIQLRCSSDKGQEDIRKTFLKHFTRHDNRGMEVRHKVLSKESSFYLVKKKLLSKDLPYEHLAKAILSFSENFGTIKSSQGTCLQDR